MNHSLVTGDRSTLSHPQGRAACSGSAQRGGVFWEREPGIDDEPGPPPRFKQFVPVSFYRDTRSSAVDQAAARPITMARVLSDVGPERDVPKRELRRPHGLIDVIAIRIGDTIDVIERHGVDVDFSGLVQVERLQRSRAEAE